MKQEWLCEGCLKDGAVSVPLSADVWAVVQKINVHHQRKSPQCPVNVRGLRVRNREIMSMADWRKMRFGLRAGRTEKQP